MDSFTGRSGGVVHCEKAVDGSVLFVTPPADAYGKSDAMRSSDLLQELNCRLISAGFKTNLPMYARHPDGHVMMDYLNRAIEILSTAWMN